MDKPRLYLTYSHSDSQVASRLALSLRNAGVEVSDPSDISVGSFSDVISQEISRSDWLVFLISPESLNSNFVQVEVNYALARVYNGKMKGVIPFVVKSVKSSDMSPIYSVLHRIDATSNFDRAISALLSSIGISHKVINPDLTPFKVTPNVFVSHSHEDEMWCTPFASALEAQGVNIWYDKKQLRVGSAWISTIEQELLAREIFMVILTPEAWNSDWVQLEYQLALMEKRQIVVVLHKKTLARGFIRTFQWIDVIGIDGTRAALQVADALKSH